MSRERGRLLTKDEYELLERENAKVRDAVDETDLEPAEWFKVMQDKCLSPLDSDHSKSQKWEHLCRVGKDVLFSNGLWPNPKWEPFRQYDFEGILRTQWAVGNVTGLTREDIREHLAEECAGQQMVFLDGVFTPELSDYSELKGREGVFLMENPRHETYNAALMKKLKAHLKWIPEIHVDLRKCQGTKPLGALNQAVFNSVGCLILDDGVELEKPVQFLWLGGKDQHTDLPAISHPKMILELGQDAKAHVYQSYAGVAPQYFQNGLTRVVLKDRAELVHSYLQDASEEARIWDTVAVEAADNTTYRATVVAIGASDGRVNLHVNMGLKTNVEYDGVNLVGEDQVLDIHTTFVQNAKGSVVEQNQRNILAHESSVCLVKCFVVVEEEAADSDTNQQLKTLLLADGAEITQQPCLELHTGEIKASHGATISDLDENELFYLQARGLSSTDAKLLTLTGFAREQYKKIPFESAQARIEAKMQVLIQQASKAVKDQVFYMSV